PRADVGYLLATYTEPGGPPNPLGTSPVTAEPGFPSRAALAERYVERSGRELDALPWFEGLALWKAAVFCEAIYGRYVRGELAAVEEGVLDRARLVLVAVACEQVVVEVLAARAHAADVERVVLLERVAPALDVVGRERRHRRRDLEALARAVEREDGPRLLRRPEDRQPAVRDLDRLLDRLRRDRRDVDRDLGAQRSQHQLQRLAEPGRAVARVRDVVVRAVVLEHVAPERRAHELDVLARLPE